MKCPKCAAVAPPFATKEGVEMNFCRGCKGLWFDKGELALYCEAADDVHELEASLPTARETAYACTKCPGGVKLRELPYHPKEELLVDWCPTCHGAFLDAKELWHAERITARYEKQAVRLRRALERLAQDGYVVLGTK